MADNSPEKPDAAAPAASTEQVPASGPQVADEGELAAKVVDKSEGDATMEEAKSAEEPKAPETAETAAEAPSAKPAEDEKKTDADGDAEMKDAADNAAEAEADATAAADTPAAKGKSRRKSTAGESKGKTLSKKGSKARLTHIDAQPGDHFLVKLKGFPAWPAIICDEDMLPQALINTRPVSAARPDGSYSEAYADGGKRVHDRSFPVMYLYTNEFGWVANTALSELTSDKARDTIADKMRKDLKAAFELAIEQNSIEHYKGILQSFQDELIAQEEAKKEAAATKKSKKGKAKASDDEDVDMEDVDEAPKPKPKKRKAAEEEASVPQRSDSVKKPKIKLNTSSTSKSANGTAAPKAKEEKPAKAAKAKAKKSSDKKSDAPKEAKLTPEERHLRKEKEVLYLRHKLQRGLLTREQQPREDEMESMSSFINILEKFEDLEVSIIRGTKINKVFKAILKLDSIPREEDFKFKKRSQALLDKWNKLLASEPASANGVNGAESKDSSKPAGNSGVKEGGDKDKDADEEKPKEDAEESVTTAKDEEPQSKEDVSEEKNEKAEAEAAPVSAAVEAAA
ncbi:hypothetical protein V8C35DRAFT_277346 [Trichoderma chlorosporum]